MIPIFTLGSAAPADEEPNRPGHCNESLHVFADRGGRRHCLWQSGKAQGASETLIDCDVDGQCSGRPELDTGGEEVFKFLGVSVASATPR